MVIHKTHHHPHESSMTSFLSRMANEASAALSDAYGHVMHGDDAGSSARIVWVIRPSRVTCHAGGGMDNSGEGAAPGGVDGVMTTNPAGALALNSGGGGGGGETNGISPSSSSYFPTASLFTQKFGEFGR